MPFTLCVTGSQVRGGAQKIMLNHATTFSNFTAQLEDAVDFTATTPGPHVIDTIALYDSDFEEYMLVTALANVPVKAKIRVELVVPALAASGRDSRAGGRSPLKSQSNALGFYSDVCDSVLLPTIEGLTGVSAASLSAMLSEGFVNNSEDPHNAQVRKLEKLLQDSVEGKQRADASRYVEALSPGALNQPGGGGNTSRPTSALGGRQLFNGVADESREEVPAAHHGARKSAGPRRQNKAAPAPMEPLSPAAPVTMPYSSEPEVKQVNFYANPSSATAEVQRQPPSQAARVAAPVVAAPADDSVILYCVYNGTTSQRAKAVKVNRSNPQLSPVLALLKDKFKSDVSLGYIEQDGAFYELLEDEDLTAVIGKVATANGGSAAAGGLQRGITLHCWGKASQPEMELAYGHSNMSSRAVTPSGKSNRSYASSHASQSSVKSKAASASSKRRERRAAGLTSPKDASEIRSSSGKLDVSGAKYTTEQLEELFDQLDLDNSGYLDKEEMEKYFLATYDSMGDTNHLKKFRGFLDSCGALDDGKVSLEEFSIIVLKLAQW